MINETRCLRVAPRTRMLVLKHIRQRLAIADVMRHLVPLYHQLPELIPDGRNPYHLASLKVIQQATTNFDIVTIRHQQGVQHRLCPVRHRLRATRLEFQGYRQCFRATSGATVLFCARFNKDCLHCGVDVALQPVLRRPDVLLNVKKFVDSNYGCSCAAMIRNSRFGL